MMAEELTQRLSGKRVLVLNGGYSDIPLIEAAIQLGAYVITTGFNSNYPGNKLSHHYVECDYRDRDAIERLAVEQNIDAICSCCNDEAMQTACFVSERLGLKGHDSYENSRIIHRKNLFKLFCSENGVLTPAAESYSNYTDAVHAAESKTFPVIVKPVDQTGGYGISVVDSAAEYMRAVEYALGCSDSGCIVVEEFVEGDLCSFSTFIIDGRVVCYFSDQEFSHYNDFAVSTSAGPYRDTERFNGRLIEQIETIAKGLSLVDGLLHVQYIAGRGKPYIIEITRRMSGDFYANPVTHSTGLEWAKLVVLAEAGELPPAEAFARKQKGFVGRHCIMSDSNGQLQRVDISPELQGNIYESRWFVEPGDVIDDCKRQKLGILFLSYSSREEMDEKTSKIRSLVSIKMREE